MNTQKKRGPLEVSDERFEKTPWTSLTPQGARQGRVPSSKASNLKERHWRAHTRHNLRSRNGIVGVFLAIPRERSKPERQDRRSCI